MIPSSIKIEIPTDWTADQAYAVSDFIDALLTAIWEVHDQKIVDVIIKRNNCLEFPPSLDEHRPADAVWAGSDNPQANDDDIPF